MSFLRKLLGGRRGDPQHDQLLFLESMTEMSNEAERIHRELLSWPGDRSIRVLQRTRGRNA